MTRLLVRRTEGLRGRIRLPGDLHIGQQALVWAALANSRSRVRGLSPRRDHQRLMAALRAMGVALDGGLDDGTDVVSISGAGVRGLRMPRGALAAGDSESTLVLLTSLLAGQTFGTRIEAQGPLQQSLRTVIGPLRERGAQVAGTSAEGDLTAPVAVAPLLQGERLEGVEIGIPQGDPNTKAALLISGLYASGITAISEGMLSRDHAERALVALGLPVQTAAGMTLLDLPEQELAWPGFDWQLPGDFTLACYVMAAALALPGSDVILEGVGLNPTRTAFLEALNHTGARVQVLPKGDCAGNEPLGDLRVQSSKLGRVVVAGERAFRMLDELPALAALAACARERIVVRDAQRLRDQRPDALRQLTEVLGQFGIECTAYQDGVDIDPLTDVRAAQLSDALPPPLQLLGVVLGLSAHGVTRIDGAEQLEACYPGLIAALIEAGGNIEVAA